MRPEPDRFPRSTCTGGLPLRVMVFSLKCFGLGLYIGGRKPRLSYQPEVNETGGRRQWRGARTMAYLLLFLVLLPLTPAIGAPTDTVVCVVGLDEEGNPQNQGLGVVLAKEGRILTSAALLAPYRGAIIITADGTKYPIRQVSQWNFFQDLVLAQVEAAALSPAPLGAKNVSPQEIVWVAVRKNPPALKEVRVTKVLPFSPRLVILKLDPGDLETDPGAPVFNGRGELVGMRHAFAQKQGKPFHFFLARNRSHLPADKPTREGEKSGFTGELVDEQLINAYQKACGAFWEGVAASLRQDWPGAREISAVPCAFRSLCRRPTSAGGWHGITLANMRGQPKTSSAPPRACPITPWVFCG